jgi:hypothetical protein
MSVITSAQPRGMLPIMLVMTALHSCRHPKHGGQVQDQSRRHLQEADLAVVPSAAEHN